jgi:hypothetical protein
MRGRLIGVRLIKWIGDPPIVGEDGWRIPNWRYENRRVIALQGYTSRIIEKSDIPGLSRTYRWDKHLTDFILEMPKADADILLRAQETWELKEFVDVTDHPSPETVQHTPIIMIRDPHTQKPRVLSRDEFLRMREQRMKLRGLR